MPNLDNLEPLPNLQEHAIASIELVGNWRETQIWRETCGKLPSLAGNVRETCGKHPSLAGNTPVWETCKKLVGNLGNLMQKTKLSQLN